ncbi:MAG TPA: 4-alpha-glucanotransferase [Acidothermaceae bacterium]
MDRPPPGVLVTSLDPVLAELAAAHGVAAFFHDWRGGERQVSQAAVVSVLAALGVDASTPEAVRDALARTRDGQWRDMLASYLVVRGGATARVAVHVPHGESVTLDLELESGVLISLTQLMIWVDPHDLDGELIGEATFEIPDDVPLGYHYLHAKSGERGARSQLIVVPDRLVDPPGRHWGFMLQLYAVRSRDSWGMGDLHDLADLVTWSGRDLGADFVLVNPLHAAGPVAPMEPSPYYPSSRRFVNPIYLRVDDVPEVASLPPEDVEAVASVLRAQNVVDEDLDRDVVWSGKREILERAFAVRNDDGRGPFEDFVAAQGDALRDFATWCALVDRHGAATREWPVELQDVRSTQVAAFREAEAGLVEFHAWLQFLCSQQLNSVQAAAGAAGMGMGVVNDLAVGVSREGADAWTYKDALAHGVALGAPADMYNQQGQTWNLPPWRPDVLAALGFAPFRDLVRASFRHGGGLRIDHIIGLFRQWWVPEGATPADGTYVRLDHEAMVGIVMLEAARAGAVVIGEDLGNVEPWVRDYLRERGVYGTSILWFEHDDAGQPRAPALWRELCLASVTTHDLPPTAGYLTGEHVELRYELGLLERPIEEERRTDEAARVAWLNALVDADLLDADVVAAVTKVAEPGTVSPRRDNFHTRVEPYVDRIVDGLYAYLAATPARLIGIYLPDVVGDRRPVNQPGTVDEYPNWRVPMADEKERPVLLEELMASPRAARLARLVSGLKT